MRRIPALTPKKVIKILFKEGFLKDTQTGSHLTLWHPDGRRTVVAMHNKDLKRGTLLGIIKQAGYTVNEFLELL